MPKSKWKRNPGILWIFFLTAKFKSNLSYTFWVSINVDFGLNKEIFPIIYTTFSFLFFFPLKKLFYMAHAVYSPLPVFRIDKILLSTCWFLCVWKEKNISPKQIKGKTNCSLGLILTNFSLCMLIIRIICNWQNSKDAARKMINDNIIFYSITSLITTQ